MSSYNIVKNIDKLNYVYFQPEDTELALRMSDDVSSDDLMSTEEIREKAISELDGTEKVVEPLAFSGYTDTSLLSVNDGLSVKALDSYLAAQIDIPLSEGEWYDDSYDDGVLNVVISQESNSLKVSDTFELFLSDDTSITLRVCGILENPTFEFRLTVSGDYLCSLDLVQEYISAENDMTPLIYCSQTALTELVDEEFIYNYSKNCIIIFDESASDSQLSDNLDRLSSYGYVTDKNELKEWTNVQIKYVLLKYLPTAAFLFLIGVVGLIGNTILNILNYRRHFAIFYICGSTWKGCSLINILYITFSIVISLLVLSGYFTVKMISDYSYETAVTTINILITVILCTLLLLVCGFTPYFLMKKTSPVQALYQES
ncbi:MAG: hypothetical protein LUE12_06315 [Ruminococcus sp.]|nr:hypothetical protein [Ruminococcus sp.]